MSDSFLHISRSPVVDTTADAPALLNGKAGYVPRYPKLHRVSNLTFAALLLLLLGPFLVGLMICVQMTGNGRIISRHPRLGKDRLPFSLYGFSGISGRFCRYLRLTGFDGLPQLWNVVKGDMNLLGPRPVPKGLTDTEIARDPSFAVRFGVKPGIWGHTQAVICANATQAVRRKLTYRLCRSHVTISTDAVLVLRVLGVTMVNVFGRQVKPTAGTHQAQRRAQDWQVRLETATGDYPVFSFHQGSLTTPRLDVDGHAVLTFGTTKGRRRAHVTVERLCDDRGQTVFHYLPKSGYAAHLIARYLRQETMIKPRKPAFRPPNTNDLQYEIPLHDVPETVPARR